MLLKWILNNIPVSYGKQNRTFLGAMPVPLDRDKHIPVWVGTSLVEALETHSSRLEVQRNNFQ
jgi:hypothetical protein